MTRTRSEYRVSPIPVAAPQRSLHTRHPVDTDRDALAALLLDGYRNTIDDEGEDLDDAYVAIDEYLARIERRHSFVVFEQDIAVAFSFVVIVNGTHYIDPVVVAPARKQRGLARATVQMCLASLAAAGIAEVGATITDGNIASERLFAGLGFGRCGEWK
jgi:ribosomal protein S18 acetylase RimI-like enzyme